MLFCITGCISSFRVTGDIPDFSRKEEAHNFLTAIAGFEEHLKQLAGNNQPMHGVIEYTALNDQKTS